ncbi:leucyl/phenylalanyl-tRNA--protein transferase [Chromobacterium amazonense]|uniref:Leucyl/phenylalanyl-tRNA--protein transferase n=1 Tax=Chromobacterium amazonense TaxID=1382803 RepID=A0A1S1WSQ3_9NEIS|nr:leucyl/phenylalanyl-tRNA--protein transferase [Chromobacterium amazonense]KIA79498.1 leucyl/phenylalanyl-tRNA--protein transferase [Chromobacterium piscinae]MBM2883510.1 leucyl/phenylalanyl-tRNA--protein transferase [Chromobacterium amazonense]MDE1712357.1 leucyl/phenylalanyl-tRNA--protein transferase [Chromobacterium amazonense]OHX10119.1 leucyl/phenylalanyl-tRNA--protein transferase [Chromobacterium amazonense]PRP69795.1 leucyl/phenylalanyl-tRNA--protein transferase [Chromobacterium amazo
MIPWLGPEPVFPPVTQALGHPNGLLAAGGDLSPRRILCAYSEGIFPWFSEGEPILWWSPAPRMVLYPEELKVSRSLAKTLRNLDYEIRVDSAFDEVMRACAEPRAGQDGTWIVPEMVAAYCRLHQLGYAHSFETWIGGELVGGLYGVAIGRMFYGESMFSRRADASKLAFVHMVRHLAGQGVGMIDCQMHTAHLASLGARLVPRDVFLATLKERVGQSQPDRMWEYHYRHEPS